jgi:hypothetical protein
LPIVISCDYKTESNETLGHHQEPAKENPSKLTSPVGVTFLEEMSVDDLDLLENFLLGVEAASSWAVWRVLE